MRSNDRGLTATDALRAEGLDPASRSSSKDNYNLGIGGVKYDNHKLRFDLIPFQPLRELAYVYTYGATKYEDRNWEKGLRWGRLIGAAFRHLTDWLLGERRDPESGCHHLAQVAFCVLGLIQYEYFGVGEDDRPGSALADVSSPSMVGVTGDLFPDYLKAVAKARELEQPIPKWLNFTHGREQK